MADLVAILSYRLAATEQHPPKIINHDPHPHQEGCELVHMTPDAFLLVSTVAMAITVVNLSRPVQ